jgi:hypothetical protein
VGGSAIHLGRRDPSADQLIRHHLWLHLHLFLVADEKHQSYYFFNRTKIAFSTMLSARLFSRQVARGNAVPTIGSIRGLADVQVEHGRGEWKTYGDIENYKQGAYQIKCFNKISKVGLAQFPAAEYDIRGNDDPAPNAHAILLRSHKLKEEEVPKTVRAIAR